jgi:hypothetical protein
MSSPRSTSGRIILRHWPTCTVSSPCMWPLPPVGQSWARTRRAWLMVRSSISARSSGSSPNALIPSTLFQWCTDRAAVAFCHSMRLASGLLLRTAPCGMAELGAAGEGCANERRHRHRMPQTRWSLACSGAWRRFPCIAWLLRRSVIQYDAYHRHQFSVASCRSGLRGYGG